MKRRGDFSSIPLYIVCCRRVMLVVSLAFSSNRHALSNNYLILISSLLTDSVFFDDLL